MPPGRGYPQDHLPGAVVLAVALLGLVFLGGALYLYTTGVFRPPLDIQAADFPTATVLGTSYRGTALGINSVWREIEAELNSGKVAHGPAIMVYPSSPLKLRPIALEGFVGYLAVFPLPAKLPPGIRSLDLSARHMLRVRIPGQGVLTGMRAFRFAQKLQGQGDYRLADGERYELRVSYRGQPCVEHWLPLGGGSVTEEVSPLPGPSLPKSRWPSRR